MFAVMAEGACCRGFFAVLNVGAREDPTPEDIRLAYDTTDVLLLDEPTARLAPALKIALPAINAVSECARAAGAPTHPPCTRTRTIWVH